jgi:uncharacterized protein (TIGR03382 family)
VMQDLTLDDGTTKFGDVSIALTVVPDMGSDESSDGNEVDAEPDGGCNAGGGGSVGVLFALALVTGLRRRRRTV